MNTIFGIWRPGGAPVTTQDLSSLCASLNRFSADDESLLAKGEIGMGLRAWPTDLCAYRDSQPLTDSAANVLVYDGRLDNISELQSTLDVSGDDLTPSATILAAYRKWGLACFGRLIGDWALALWDEAAKALYLARDHAGMRTMYYSRSPSGNVIWSTYLDCFIGSNLLDEPDPDYIASYLAMMPNYKNSPYYGVHSLVPGHVLQFREDSVTQVQFWTPLVQNQHLFGSPRDYDERFLALLEQSVRRRTGPGAPILAQLSGGMDSTTVVCLSDRIRHGAEDKEGILDTLSYFDDTDPAWNEKPYFSIVEEQRGKHGIHLDASLYRTSLAKHSDDQGAYLFPGTCRSEIRMDQELLRLVGHNSYRAMISGIGGDELTGGAVDPAFEVADYLASAKLKTAIIRATSWCLATRENFFDMMSQSVRHAVKGAKPAHAGGTAVSLPWLTEPARARCREVLHELPTMRDRHASVRPSAAEASFTWWYMLRTQPHLRPSEVYRYEYRYPYLDRDLVEFLLKVPPKELAGPGRRRLMMRRALKGIVPEAILERRRKAYLLQSRLKHVNSLLPDLDSLMKKSRLADMGYVDISRLQSAIGETITGQNIQWWGFILRYAQLETWLRFRSDYPLRASTLRAPAVQQAVPSVKVPVSE